MDRAEITSPGARRLKEERNLKLVEGWVLQAVCQTSKTRVRARLDIRTGRLARTASRRARAVRAKCSLILLA